MSTKARELLQYAQELEPSVSDWYAFHNALFGISGRLQELFTTEQERAEFFESPEYREIEQLGEGIQKREADAPH
ncbi:MAG: hypothetical protein NXI29_18340 [bacterium]|nr:hypothetical protein [bacterium]